MSGLINQVGARSGIIFSGSLLQAGTKTLSGTTGLDYEEGTFSPTPGDGIANAGYSTGDNQTFGTYTRIGNLVYIRGRITLDGSGSVGGGTVAINGLPYVSISRTTGDRGLISCFIYASASVPTNFTGASFSPPDNGRYMYLDAETSSGGRLAYSGTQLGVSGEFWFTGWYLIS